MKFLGGATILDSFLKAYKANETKNFSPRSGLTTQKSLIIPKGRRMKPSFFSELRNNNPLEKDFKDYEKLRKSRLDEQHALKKLQVQTVPPSGLDNYN